jgi:multidrug efflux pump subunit AcrA (membrane-fusion protein)
VTVDLEGLVEPAVSQEIVLRPDEWDSSTGWTIKSVVQHGASVKAGDVLIRFDTKKIDQAISDLQAELKLGEISMQQAEQQLAVLEKTTPLDIAANQRTARIANEDNDYYFDVRRPYTLKMAEHQLQSAKHMLEYAQEELDQLEKMYTADDLTEETEEIVLKRARHSVESAKLQMEGAQMRYDQEMKYNLPRSDEQQRESHLRSQLSTQTSKLTIPQALQKQRLEMRKLRETRRRSEEKLARLQADRSLMVIKSPTTGIVYYGNSNRGKFADATSMAATLCPHGNAQPGKVLMTIVRPAPISILATVPEDKLYRVTEGLSAVVTPKAFPKLKLNASVQEVSKIPLAPGSFEASLKVARNKGADALMPGMACTVKLVSYVNEKALVVPPKAVKTDDDAEDESYVFVQGKDGKAERRAVTVGEKNDKQAEILKGLAEGDIVLLEAPKQ